MSKVYKFPNKNGGGFQHTFKWSEKGLDGFWKTHQELIYTTHGKGQSAYDAAHKQFIKDYPSRLIIRHYID